MDSVSSTQASQSAELGDLQSERPNMSYADFHPEMINNVENIPQEASGNYQKQQAKRKEIENGELVKYMSNLPSYLEKDENLKERALNFGVLDWHRLEKWQCNQKPLSSQDSRCSPSSSNTSFFSTDVSSTRSSRGCSCSPAYQMMHRPTLPSHLTAYPNEDCSKVDESVVENVGRYQDHKAVSSNPFNGQQNIFRMYQSFSKNQSEIKTKESRWKDAEPQIIQQVKTFPDFVSHRAASRSKGKAKIQDSKSTSGQDELQKSCQDAHHNYIQRCRMVGLSRNESESSQSAISSSHDLTKLDGQRSTEASRRSYALGSSPKKSHNEGCCSESPDSYPLLCEDLNIKCSQIKQPGSIDAQNINFSSEAPLSPCSVKMSTSPSRGKNHEEKSTVMPRNSAAIKSPDRSHLKKNTVEPRKLRNPSPTRRFSIALGRIGRISSSRDSSEHITGKCESEKVVDSSSLRHGSIDKPNSTTRSQSSPLRRLLDPLLKPKASNSHHIPELLEKDPASADRICKPSNGRADTVHSMKVKLDLSSCKNVNVNNPHQKKHGPSKVQALLQIAVKNGLPLFTFAVDNKSDILAATMRKASASRKDENCWIYTFLTVREVKKKNGWISQGGKGKSHGIVPNVVAQMKVSDSQFSNLDRHNSVNELNIREFVLSASDQRQVDQHELVHPHDNELAAIIVKFPKDNLLSPKRDGQQGNFCNDRSTIETQALIDTTVVLPGGVHGQPSKGEPSPLIERWISGGLCDCGGWDLGCRLMVLSNQTKPSNRSTSSKTHQSADRFELFSQGEVLDDRPIFSLSPFKDKIFSVEFNSSLSLLQAFSICIAVINSRRPYELSELSKLFEDKSSEETSFPINDRMKGTSQVLPEVLEFPVSYASYPPISPVGRV